MRISIVGANTAAKRILDEFVHLEGVQVAGIYDNDQEALAELATHYMGLDTFDQPGPMLTFKPDVILVVSHKAELLGEIRAVAQDIPIVEPAVMQLWFSSLDTQKATDESTLVSDHDLVTDAEAALSSATDQLRNLLAGLDQTADALSQLALNAAVETAKAGAHGRDFLPVTDALRNLSEHCNREVKSVAELLYSLQGHVTRLRDSLGK